MLSRVLCKVRLGIPPRVYLRAVEMPRHEMDRFLSMAILVYCALERYLFILIPQPSIVKTFQLGSHPPRREFLALLVACIILVPSLLASTPSTTGSATSYSLRDELNHPSISQPPAARCR